MTVVVDTSALLAVVFGEVDAARYLDALIAHVGELVISTANLVEARVVAEARRGRDGATDLAELLTSLQVVVVEQDLSQADAAVQAWRRFGKGRHPAGLNLCDCFSYALASQFRARLLYKGNDFRQTDIPSVLD